MDTEIIPLDDETQLYCNLGRHGWSELIIAFKGKITTIRVSGVFTDLSHEILKVCRAAIENYHVRIALCDEPGGSILELKTDKKQQHTVILSLFDVKEPAVAFDADHEGELVLSIRIRRQRLLGMLVAELWKTHMHLKQPSYQKSRGTFPHAELIEINDLWDKSPMGPSFLK